MPAFQNARLASLLLALGTLSALDVAPTVLQLFGLPIPEAMTGRPLLEGAVPSSVPNPETPNR